MPASSRGRGVGTHRGLARPTSRTRKAALRRACAAPARRRRGRPVPGPPPTRISVMLRSISAMLPPAATFFHGSRTNIISHSIRHFAVLNSGKAKSKIEFKAPLEALSFIKSNAKCKFDERYVKDPSSSILLPHSYRIYGPFPVSTLLCG